MSLNVWPKVRYHLSHRDWNRSWPPHSTLLLLKPLGWKVLAWIKITAMLVKMHLLCGGHQWLASAVAALLSVPNIEGVSHF